MGWEFVIWSLRMLLFYLNGGGGSPTKGIHYRRDWYALYMGVTPIGLLVTMI